MPVNFEDLVEDGQCTIWQSAFVIDDRPVQVIIKHDRSYPNQSMARAQVWHDDHGFVTAFTLPWPAWAKSTQRTGHDLGQITVGIVAAADTLVTRLFDLLGGK